MVSSEFSFARAYGYDNERGREKETTGRTAFPYDDDHDDEVTGSLGNAAHILHTQFHSPNRTSPASPPVKRRTCKGRVLDCVHGTNITKVIAFLVIVIFMAIGVAVGSYYVMQDRKTQASAAQTTLRPPPPPTSSTGSSGGTRSSPPTVAPTRMEEEISIDCSRDTYRYFYVSERFGEQNCRWLQNRPVEQQRLCRPNESGYRYCPKTCGVCDTPTPTMAPPTSVSPTSTPSAWQVVEVADSPTTAPPVGTALTTFTPTLEIVTTDILPTAIPTTTDPTVSPTVSTDLSECRDREDTFFVNDVWGEQDCNWLRLQPIEKEWLCLPQFAASRICRQTCDVCTSPSEPSSTMQPTLDQVFTVAPTLVPTTITPPPSSGEQPQESPPPFGSPTLSPTSEETIWETQVPTSVLGVNPDPWPVATPIPTFRPTRRPVVAPPQPQPTSPVSQPDVPPVICTDDPDVVFPVMAFGNRSCFWLSRPLRVLIRVFECVPSRPAYSICPVTCGGC